MSKKSVLTLQDAFELFIRKCGIKNLSDLTIKTYGQKMVIFYKFMDRNEPITAVTSDTMDDYILWLRDNMGANDISINSYMRSMRAFLYYCMECNYIPSFKIKLIKAEKKLKEIYSDKVSNYFYNNNIAYLYMERILDRSETYSLSYDGETSLDLASGTYQLSYTALKNGMIIENPSLTYIVDNEEIAKVSDSGLLELLTDGIVTVTAIWTDGKEVSCKSVISVVGEIEPDPPVVSGRTVITGNTAMRNGYARTFGARFYDSSDNEVTGVAAVWTITDCTFDSSIIDQTVLDDNKIRLLVDDENVVYEEGRFTLNASDAEGNYMEASVIVTINE